MSDKHMRDYSIRRLEKAGRFYNAVKVYIENRLSNEDL